MEGQMAHNHSQLPPLNPLAAKAAMQAIDAMVVSGQLSRAEADGAKQAILDAALPRSPGQESAHRIIQLPPARRDRVESQTVALAHLFDGTIKRAGQGLDELPDSLFEVEE